VAIKDVKFLVLHPPNHKPGGNVTSYFSETALKLRMVPSGKEIPLRERSTEAFSSGSLGTNISIKRPSESNRNHLKSTSVYYAK